MVSVLKREIKNFGRENRVALELNEKGVIELLKDLSNILGAFLIKKSIPLSIVGYEMIKANEARSAELAVMSYPTRARGIIVNRRADI